VAASAEAADLQRKDCVLARGQRSNGLTKKQRVDIFTSAPTHHHVRQGESRMGKKKLLMFRTVAATGQELTWGGRAGVPRPPGPGEGRSTKQYVRERWAWLHGKWLLQVGRAMSGQRLTGGPLDPDEAPPAVWHSHAARKGLAGFEGSQVPPVPIVFAPEKAGLLGRGHVRVVAALT